MSPPLLHEAAEADAPAVVEILHESFSEYLERLEPPSGVHRETAQTIRDTMKTARWVLATVDSYPVACVMYEPREDFMYLGRLAVLPAYRRRGIGNALIAYVEDRARRQGLGRVRLGVRVALPALRARYERLGYRFIEARTHPGYSQPTYEIFEKWL